MIGVAVELVISWALLWFLYKQDLSALGISPTLARGGHLVFGFALAATFCGAYHSLHGWAAQNLWLLNDDYTTIQFASGLWFTLKSVLFEELIFRGALLYIAMDKLGDKQAIALSSVAFGIYHWFTMGFGNWIFVIYIFIATAVAGWMFAFAFVKTRSLYLPVGLHLGWNAINIVIFSSGPPGNQLLIHENQNQPEGILSIAILLFQVFGLPVTTYLVLKKIRSRLLL